MKRSLFSIILIAACLFAFTACSGKKPETAETSAAAQTVQAESAAAPAEEESMPEETEAAAETEAPAEAETFETAEPGISETAEDEGAQDTPFAGIAGQSDGISDVAEEEIELDEGLEEDDSLWSETDEDGYPVADRKLVAIDPGHQAHANSEKEPIGPGSSEMKAKVSSGTAGDYTGASEYQLNLDVALKLKEELLGRGYEVLMIRETNDVNISNVERASMANEAHADAFIRIHADGSEDHSAHGCFTICQTSANPYNGDIYSECNALAEAVLKGLVASTGAKNRGVMRSDTYSGINWSKVPVTIVEMGYMSNQEEDTLMQTEEYQYRIAKGLADGLDLYFGK